LKAFTFSLKSVLEQKGWLEVEATRRLAVEVKRLQNVKEAIVSLQEGQESLRGQRSKEIEFTAPLQLQYVIYHQKLSLDLEQANLKLRKHKGLVSKRQLELQKAVMEVKKLDKLKEREKESFKEEKKQKEMDVMNEISTNFFSRHSR